MKHKPLTLFAVATAFLLVGCTDNGLPSPQSNDAGPDGGAQFAISHSSFTPPLPGASAAPGGCHPDMQALAAMSHQDMGIPIVAACPPIGPQVAHSSSTENASPIVAGDHKPFTGSPLPRIAPPNVLPPAPALPGFDDGSGASAPQLSLIDDASHAGAPEADIKTAAADMSVQAIATADATQAPLPGDGRRPVQRALLHASTPQYDAAPTALKAIHTAPLAPPANAGGIPVRTYRPPSGASASIPVEVSVPHDAEPAGIPVSSNF